jgi:hypothetical protein
VPAGWHGVALPPYREHRAAIGSDKFVPKVTTCDDVTSLWRSLLICWLKVRFLPGSPASLSFLRRLSAVLLRGSHILVTTRICDQVIEKWGRYGSSIDLRRTRFPPNTTAAAWGTAHNGDTARSEAPPR